MEIFTKCSKCDVLIEVEVEIEVEEEVVLYSNRDCGCFDYTHTPVLSYSCECGHKETEEYI